ncbi:ejaculatory bulb-specific protein 3-like [Pseudomyrmex gracilis]|uniref:ejaculatory bulb-specific protein 3-like n=1 Tax=Pseudomyrmex gracilis TaxID=219809 RepID=UPI000994E1B0|nr:ejaculatory bulb-specific protein 3-like [Pseudomyrmex gracilis]
MLYVTSVNRAINVIDRLVIKLTSLIASEAVQSISLVGKAIKLCVEYYRSIERLVSVARSVKAQKMARLSYIMAIVSVALLCVVAQELYTDKFDSIDIGALLENDMEREKQYKCMMDEGPCETDSQKFFKTALLEVLKVGCGKCTEVQKSNVKLTTEWYEKNKPEDWKRLVAKAKAS